MTAVTLYIVDGNLHPPGLDPKIRMGTHRRRERNIQLISEERNHGREIVQSLCKSRCALGMTLKQRG
jgi:hypothetical protein